MNSLMLLKVKDRPLLKTRLSKEVTLMLENEYRTFVDSRGKGKFKQIEEENEQEIMYALLISHIDSYIVKNDYVAGALLHTYFSNNNQTIFNLYTYYDNTYSFEKYVKLFVNELLGTYH